MPLFHTGPAEYGFPITPNDTTDLATRTRCVYLGVGGDLKVDLVGGGGTITFVGLAAGVVHPLRIKRVYATGTTAGSILGFT